MDCVRKIIRFAHQHVLTPNCLTFLNNLLLKYLQFISYFINFVKIFKEFFFIQHERNKFIEQSCG